MGLTSQVDAVRNTKLLQHRSSARMISKTFVDWAHATGRRDLRKIHPVRGGYEDEAVSEGCGARINGPLQDYFIP